MQAIRSVAALNRRFYPNTPDLWDEVAFRERILAHIQPFQTILDLGAGRGCRPHMNFRGLVSRVYGIDPEEAVLANPYLDVATVGFAESLPWPDATFDLVYSANVLEHLPTPVKCFQEVHRVLKPGGTFLTKTPNRWHYIQIFSSLLPEWFHQWLFRCIYQLPQEDKFPGLYRANTAAQQRKVAVAAGFEVLIIEAIEDRPGYLHFTALTHLCGILWERVVNSTELLNSFRAVLFSAFRKPH